MPEFPGSPETVALQQRIKERSEIISASPHLVNGGRLVHYLDPERIGWERLLPWIEQDGLAGFPLVTEDVTRAMIHTHLGGHWETPAWLALRGHAEAVLAASARVIAEVPLPEGWQILAETCPPPDRLEAAQLLNEATGVSPYPAYYMRSEHVPVLTLSALDPQGGMVATASVANRYPVQSRLGGHVFAGMVSVSDAARGRGFGKLINAHAMIASHREWAWEWATEQVAADNLPSLAMIRACGLTHDEGLVSMAAINSTNRFTR